MLYTEFMKSKFKIFLQEFPIFIYKQANASIFGALLLLIIILSSFLDFSTFPITRYDTLFIIALLIQIILIITKYESLREAKIIFIFHITATIMEIFKTSPEIGSWKYPENSAVFMIFTVPLFVGFLYSAVGSYISRAWKIFKFSFDYFPSIKLVSLLSILIYLNFFTHHFTFDFRYILFLASAVIFWKTRINFTMIKTHRSMPMLIGFSLVALFLYVAENIGTFAKVWVYPSQEVSWHIVPIGKYTSWFLLIIVSFAIVSILHKKSLISPQSIYNRKNKKV